ncbi:hypothetical protein CFII64_14250 [Pseudomonas sp. CFII64]|nr:hypothetical protein CFII64_14250 [Pseudomonas sp. CFII64]
MNGKGAMVLFQATIERLFGEALGQPWLCLISRDNSLISLVQQPHSRHHAGTMFKTIPSDQ